MGIGTTAALGGRDEIVTFSGAIIKTPQSRSGSRVISTALILRPMTAYPRPYCANKRVVFSIGGFSRASLLEPVLRGLTGNRHRDPAFLNSNAAASCGAILEAPRMTPTDCPQSVASRKVPGPRRCDLPSQAGLGAAHAVAAYARLRRVRRSSRSKTAMKPQEKIKREVSHEQRQASGG